MSETRTGTSLFRLPGRGILPLALLVILWLLALSHYPRLPAELPSRFVPWGAPVSWAPKSPAAFVLPATATLIYLVLGMVSFLGAAKPVIDGKELNGLAAYRVGFMIRRYLFFMRTALLAWLLNLQFRITQIAYGHRESLGWDSYLTAGLVVVFGVIGAVLLLRSSRRWLKWQTARMAGE
jgi:uncharacterized membrane protein